MFTLMFFCIQLLLPGEFHPVEGFVDLDYYATPNAFGLLLIQSGDPEADSLMARSILTSLDSLPDCSHTDLWTIAPDVSGYAEVASLTGMYPGPPSTVVLVGHCGFLEIDPQFIVSEVNDSWYTWGDPTSRMTGICNHCTRCNP